MKIDYKNCISMLLVIAITFIFNLNFLYAANFIRFDENRFYMIENGHVIKNSWAWIDMNNDSISECYRFDKDGYIAINYKDEYGRMTNDKGQLIENGFVVERLSSGKIQYGEGKPYVDIEGVKNYVFDAPYDNKKYPNEDYDSKGIIKTVEFSDDFIGPIAKGISNQVIYAGDAGISSIDVGANGININIGKTTNVVAGKNIVNFIDKKTNCKTKVDDCIVYGGTIWDDCIELRGTGAKVSFNLKNNNYMYFEVAEEPHVEDEKDINVVLEVYADNELIDTMDEFVESEPEEFSEELFDAKNIELRVKSDIYTSRRLYIHNGRFKKVKEDE